MPSVLVVEDLKKTYPGTRKTPAVDAVRGISFAVEAGETFGLLGPNGAGKSTTLGCITSLVRPTSGRIVVDGVDAQRDPLKVRRLIAVVPQTRNLDRDLSVREVLTYHGRYFGLPAAEREARADRLLEEMQLSDKAGAKPLTLSGGLQQRAMIARALMHDPLIILLDEPTSGLDPANARHVRDLIANLRQNGRALLVSTHNLHEAEELADRIAVLNTDLLADASPSALRQRLTGMHVDIEVEGPAAEWQRLLPATTVESVRATSSMLSVTLSGEHQVPDIVAALVSGGARIRRVVPRERTLEEVYLSLVGDIEGAA